MHSTYSEIYIILLSLALTEAEALKLFPPPVTSVERWESAASSIIQRYIESIYDVQIIFESTCASNEFLKTVSVPLLLSECRLRADSLLLILPQSKSFVTGMLNKAVNSTKSRYAVFIESSESVTVSWILEQCWQRNLVDVVVIEMKNDTVAVYTYFPFGGSACFDRTPVLLEELKGSCEVNNDLFPKRKVWNLRNCTLKVSSFDNHPSTYFVAGKMQGRFSPVFTAVTGSMNFSAEFIHTEGLEWYGSASGPKKTGIRGDVYTKQADLGFSFLHPSEYEYFDYDSLARTGCVTWCLPASFKKPSVWWMIVGEFTPTVWSMLFVSAIGIVVTEFMAKRLDRRNRPNRKKVMFTDDIFMDVWSALLQSPGGMPRQSSASFRLLWLFWLMSSLVLSTIYLSTLKSLTTAPNVEYSVKNLEDLANADIQPWYHKAFTAMVDDVSKGNPTVAQIKSKSFLFPPEMYGTMISLLQYANITSLMTDVLCRIYNERYVNKIELYPLPNSCMKVTSWHFFIMGKNSVYTEAVNVIVDRLTQAGLVEKCLRDDRTVSKTADVKKKPISLKTMLPSFVILACGLTLSLLVLLLESLYARG